MKKNKFTDMFDSVDFDDDNEVITDEEAKIEHDHILNEVLHEFFTPPINNFSS